MVSSWFSSTMRFLEIRAFAATHKEKRKTRKGGSLWWQCHQLKYQREFRREFCVILPVFSSEIKAVHAAWTVVPRFTQRLQVQMAQAFRGEI